MSNINSSFITTSGPIYKKNLGQLKLMYIVKELEQIH